MSYGFHRSEIIGALGSVALIWGLTIWLVYEALMRLIYRNFKIDGIFNKNCVITIKFLKNIKLITGRIYNVDNCLFCFMFEFIDR